MDDLISEEDLQTFEGFLKYQAVDPAELTPDELTMWRDYFDKANRSRESSSKVGLTCLGEQDRDIERHRHRADLGREHRQRNVMRVGAHHDRCPHGRTVGNHLTVMPDNSRRANQTIGCRNDAFAFAPAPG
jgi:hypothetical protein